MFDYPETSKKMNDTKYGKVAAGHQETAGAAWRILQEGGNAFDAALAGILAACVAESASISIGGGGFLLGHEASGKDSLYDFFVQTPLAKNTRSKLDFFPVSIDFKDNTQIFNVGLASAATPGVIGGVFHIHKNLGCLPFEVIAEPAIELAKQGVLVDDFQDYMLQLLKPIISRSDIGSQFFLNDTGAAKRKGEQVRLEGLDDTLFVLSKEGPREFYEGEIAARISTDSLEKGGHLTMQDFREYSVIRRKPLNLPYRDFRFLTNPPPSAGGILIGFCLQLLEHYPLSEMEWGSETYLQLLAQVLHQMNTARSLALNRFLQNPNVATHFLQKENIALYLQSLRKQANKLGSTTHISVVDKAGNAASTTISSGAGNSYFVPKTGIMLNNMLGEADLNPQGFHQWTPNQRISSMMAPSMLLKDGRARLVTGSSGSNRIRSAVLQNILHWADFQLPLEEAVRKSRMHLEGKEWNIEAGFDASILEDLRTPSDWQKVLWSEKSLFFGGVNAIDSDAKGNLKGAADDRRFGVVNGH